MPAREMSEADKQAWANNFRLADNIAHGKSPLTDEMIDLMHSWGTYYMNIPGPRVVQIIDRLRASETEVARLRAAREG